MKLKFGPVRDVVLLLAGLGLLGNEALIVAEPRALILGVAATMIGLPATLFADRRFLGSTTPPPPPPPPAVAPEANGQGPAS